MSKSRRSDCYSVLKILPKCLKIHAVKELSSGSQRQKEVKNE